MRVAFLMIATCLAVPAWAQPQLPPDPYPVVLPPQTFQAIVNYLKRQPWEEAQPLMAALTQAAQASQATGPKPSAASKADEEPPKPR